MLHQRHSGQRQLSGGKEILQVGLREEALIEEGCREEEEWLGGQPPLHRLAADRWARILQNNTMQTSVKDDKQVHCISVDSQVQ